MRPLLGEKMESRAGAMSGLQPGQRPQGQQTVSALARRPDRRIQKPVQTPCFSTGANARDGGHDGHMRRRDRERPHNIAGKWDGVDSETLTPNSVTNWGEKYPRPSRRRHHGAIRGQWGVCGQHRSAASFDIGRLCRHRVLRGTRRGGPRDHVPGLGSVGIAGNWVCCRF
jgi:hypothetical protein